MSDSYAAEEQQEEAAPAGPPSAKVWHDRLAEYKRQIGDKWGDQCKNLDKLYSRDERADAADREYSIFWANIEVLREAAYARPPVPVVAPRFKGKNPIARHASDILERCLITTFEQSDLHGCMQEVRDEFLRYSRGTARVRLATKRDGTECVEYDHFNADDFAHDPARKWREVKWVAFRSWLNREKGRARFNESLGQWGKSFDDVPIKKRDENSAAIDPKEDQAPVWEIWCIESGMVHFVCEDFDIELATEEPWLDLTDFWPCPKPAYGTLVPKKLKPVPDIRQYKDQIEEINTYTARIAALSESLRMKGFYPAGAGELSDAIEAAIKNLDDRAVLVPVSSFAASGGGSFADSIVWLPIEQVGKLIRELVELRRVLIDDVYQITGISDIMRGQTEASETLGAQQLKSQWGSIRIRGKQNELSRFTRDMSRITAEVIAENFQPQTIAQMSQAELPTQMQKQKAQADMQMMQQQAMMAQSPPAPGMPPQPAPPPIPPEKIKEMQDILEKPSFEEVMAFLNDDRARGFVIEVETDSTIQPDEDAEKQRRTEFVTAIGGLFQQALPVAQTMPQAIPFLGEILKFTAAGFRAGRPLEGAIDELVEQMKGAAQQMMQPKADPVAEAKQKEAETKLKGVEAQTQAKVIGAHVDMQKSEHQLAIDQQRAMIPPQNPQVQ